GQDGGGLLARVQGGERRPDLVAALALGGVKGSVGCCNQLQRRQIGGRGRAHAEARRDDALERRALVGDGRGLDRAAGALGDADGARQIGARQQQKELLA